MSIIWTTHENGDVSLRVPGKYAGQLKALEEHLRGPVYQGEGEPQGNPHFEISEQERVGRLLFRALKTLRSLVNKGGVPRYSVTPGAALNSVIEEMVDPALRRAIRAFPDLPPETKP